MSQYSQFPTSPGAGGSDVNLSNLASPTAINQHLLPVTNVTYNLGSSTLKWLNLFVGTATVYTSLNMSSQKIINVLDPTSAQDAATKAYVDTQIGGDIHSDGSIAFTANQSLGGFKIINLGTPTLTTDATTKAYVDNKVLVYTSSAGAGGAATEAMVLTGILATDTIMAVTQKTPGANNLPLLGYTTLANDALTCTWSADPGAGSVVIVHIKR